MQAEIACLAQGVGVAANLGAVGTWARGGLIGSAPLGISVEMLTAVPLDDERTRNFAAIRAVLYPIPLLLVFGPDTPLWVAALSIVLFTGVFARATYRMIRKWIATGEDIQRG